MPTQYNYPTDSNKLTNLAQSGSSLRSFVYDAAGNVTADDRLGTVYGYFYNDRGRLKQSRLNNQVRANYRYDFFERLNYCQTVNMTPAGVTNYLQDLAGRLVAEADGSTGATQREYIWVNDLPLAVVEDGTKIYYVHADHLNRPLKMTDAAQAVVWDAVYRPFGEVHSITGSASLNLRFPGQYFLIENGLTYNWYRHYDATIGRYTQPDPLWNVAASAPSNLDAPILIVPRETSEVSQLTPSVTLRRNYDPQIGTELPEFGDGPTLYAYARSQPTMSVDPTGLLTGPFTPIPQPSSNPACPAAMSCSDAHAACLRAGRGSQTCLRAYINCSKGFPTIFGPGIVGTSRL